MKADIGVKFPQGKIYLDKIGKTKVTARGISTSIEVKPVFEPNPRYENFFNNNLNLTQVFLDNKVIIELQKYVSKKYGVQELSIRLGSDPGSGKVHINVPYAYYQAYSNKIKKRAGLRGKQPFERMCADKKDEILRQTAEYSRRVNQ